MVSTTTATSNGSNDPPAASSHADDADVRSVDTADKTESEYEMEGDYNVLQTQIVDTQTSEEAAQAQLEDPDWSARTSFTADSPYFDAFCEGEIGSLNVLSETLGDISQKARIFVRTGAMMSEATRQLALACQLRRDVVDDNNNNFNNNAAASEEFGLSEEEMQKQRRDAVGEEMASILELLGQVRMLSLVALLWILT